MKLDLAKALIKPLPAGLPTLFNPWVDRCVHDTAINTPQAKLERLALHLDCKPSLILVGEAPGYQGCRTSGMAFTSERLLLEGSIPRVSRPEGRLCDRKLPFSEPSATIVWRTLYRLGLAETTILWNALQMHPVGGRGEWSNRTPTDDELRIGIPSLRLLSESYPDAKVIAVGRKAEMALAAAAVDVHAAVRHPANGGATAFAQGVSAWAS